MIIAIYGISGCGKTSLCREIEEHSKNFKIIDGSALMDELIPGGISSFKKMTDKEKYMYREIVVKEIESRHRHAPYHTIVTGHYAFLKKGGVYEVAWTEADGEVYDYIFCIQSAAESIKYQCLKDISRIRSNYLVSELENWQNFECQELEEKCNFWNIPFSLLTSCTISDRLIEFYKTLSQHDIFELCKELEPNSKCIYSIFDCDGTLFSGDCLDYLTSSDSIDSGTVNSIFKKRIDYCFESFFEAAQYYSTIPQEAMQHFINRTAQSIVLDSQILDILKQHACNRKIIWITSGFPEIWNIVAKRYGLDVKVIGGNNLAQSNIIVSNEEKALFVSALVGSGAHVTAFGDSLADAKMLENAQKAVVVISKKRREKLLEHLSNHKNVSIIDIRQNRTAEMIK